MPDLVFFRVEVFLTARLAGPILTKLESGAVDAVACPERRRQYHSDHEIWLASYLEVLGQNVGSIRPETGAGNIPEPHSESVRSDSS